MPRARLVIGPSRRERARAVDLVDEQNVAFLQIGEQAGEIAAFSTTGPEVTRTLRPIRRRE